MHLKNSARYFSEKNSSRPRDAYEFSFWHVIKYPPHYVDSSEAIKIQHRVNPINE